MALIVIPGAVDANSYISEADADLYFADRLHAVAWTAANLATKEAVLKWATRILDWQEWLGSRASLAQYLRWPRSGVLNIDHDAELDLAAIPRFLEEATCELAILLIESDITATPGTAGISEIKVSDIELKLDLVHNRPGMLPLSVQELIGPYLEAGSIGFVDIVRS